MLERSFKAPPKLQRNLPTDIEIESVPLTELSSFAEDIHVEREKSSQNTNLDAGNF